MNRFNFTEIQEKLSEVSKFVKIKRKKIAKEISVEINLIEKKIVTLENNEKNLKMKIKLLEQEQKTMSDNYSELKNKHTFLTQILSATSEHNKDFETFKNLVENDFIDFTNNINSVTNRRNINKKLMQIVREVKESVTFGKIRYKNKVVVAGGFSSGKTEFISSFFKKDTIKLPIGITPVTAIPTYIISSEQDNIYGFTNNDGKFILSPKQYESMSHNFVKSFGFNLKEILPFIVVETPMHYSDICFIDTPGYNPGVELETFTNEDKNISKEYLEKANTLIWIVGIDSNGTLPLSDLNFLQNFSFTDKELYFVINKADLRSEEDLQGIINNFAENLDLEDIKYKGISAYSSINKNEVIYKKESLLQFLDSVNKKVDIFKSINIDIQNIFNEYESAMKKDSDIYDKINKNLKSLKLDIIEEQLYEIEPDKIFKKIDYLGKYFNEKKEDLAKKGKVFNELTKDILNTLS